MPEYRMPGVYVSEVDGLSPSVVGVTTSVAGIVGLTERRTPPAAAG